MHRAFHAAVLLDSAGVRTSSLLSLNFKVNFAALHRAGQRCFTKRALILAGELLAILLESEGWRAGTGGGLNLKDPGAADIRLVAR